MLCYFLRQQQDKIKQNIIKKQTQQKPYRNIVGFLIIDTCKGFHTQMVQRYKIWSYHRHKIWEDYGEQDVKSEEWYK